MSWLAGSWASTTDDALVHALRDGRLTGLRLFVWGLFPSLSGREERVEVVIRSDGDTFIADCQVQETEPGIVEETFTARWDEPGLIAWVARARASTEPSLWVRR
jgi:hypothetical protein